MSPSHASLLDSLRHAGLRLRERLALAAWIDETDAEISRRFGVCRSAITHRRRRGLAKLTPEQRQHYLKHVNRRRNRTVKRTTPLLSNFENY